MRRALAIGAAAAACAAAAGGLTGCGGGGSLQRPLAYLPAGTPAVALVSTDLDDSQWHTFNGEVAPLLLSGSVRRLLRETTEQAGLSFGDDVKPLLGNPLVVGVTRGTGREPPLVAALQVREADKLEKVLRALDFAPAGRYRGARLYRPPTAVDARLARRGRAGSALVAVDGDVLLAALGETTLRRALDQRRRGGGLTRREVDRGLHGLPGDALLRLYGNLRAVAAAAPPSLPWARALRTYGLSVTLERRVIEARAVVRTASRELTDAQLPLAPGRDPAPIPVREDEAVVGLRDAAPTAAFALAALAGKGAGQGVGSAAAARARAGGPGVAIPLVAGLLRQLSGPAFAAFDPDGDVWARAGVRDPRAAARALRRAAGRLGLRRAGGGLFRTAGGGLVVGVVGGALVTGPSPGGARAAASEPTVALSSTRGGLVARADLAALGDGIERATGIQLGALDEVVAFVKADRAGLRAVLRVGIRP